EVGDVQQAVGAEGQAVGLAVVLDDEFDDAPRKDPEYAPPGYVAEPQAALIVEHGAFYETGRLDAGALQAQPRGRAFGMMVFAGQSGEYRGRRSRGCVEHVTLF